MKLVLVLLSVFLFRDWVIAGEHTLFELHAVVKNADDTTELYSLPQREGHSEAILVKPEVLLDQSSIKWAVVQKDSQGAPQILLTLTPEGGKKFGDITEQHLGERLAMFLNGRLETAPVIRSKIAGGSLIISGNFTQAEADTLAAKINASLEK